MMAIKIMIFFIASGTLLGAFNILNAPLHDHPAYDNGQRSIEYHFSCLFSRCRPRPKVLIEKNKLKEIATNIYMHSSNQKNYYYPENPQDLNFDKSLFYFYHIKNPQKHLPIDWQVPDSWAKLNRDNTPILFLIKAGQKFTGRADQPLAIIKNRFLFNDEIISVVYEDGHVGTVPKKEALKLWQSAEVEL